MENDKIPVTFTHPRNNGHFTANISPLCTGQRAIQGLLVGNDRGPFLEAAEPGRPYELAIKRTGDAITPNTTFADAGVQAGDVIEVSQKLVGAVR